MNRELTEAIIFATRKHANQKRKYTGEPYIVHPLRVMDILSGHCQSPLLLKAAVLHDVLEDTDTKPLELELRFGASVCRLVEEVTQVSRPGDGNRAKRVAMDNDHYAMASAYGAAIKLADFMDNIVCVTRHDPKFARVYLDEKKPLLPRLRHVQLVPDLRSIYPAAQRCWADCFKLLYPATTPRDVGLPSWVAA